MKMKKIIPILIAAVLFAGCGEPKPDAVAQHYSQALRSGDFELFKSLFQEDKRKFLNEETFHSVTTTYVEILAIAPPYITVQTRIPWDGTVVEQTGTVYLLPNSRIKYAPIFMGHPALALRGLLSQMGNDHIGFRQSAFRTLTNWELPHFGFDPDAAPALRSKSVDHFREWVEKNESTFDLGKIKIPVSPIDLERMRKAAHNH